MAIRFVSVFIGLIIYAQVLCAQTKQLELQSSISLLEKGLLTKDTSSLNIVLHEDLSMGHSNGWVENKEDLLLHLSSGFLVYNEIKSIGELEVNEIDNFARVRRKIKVKGRAGTVNFEMELKVLEIWVNNRNEWKLWSRQSVQAGK